MTGFAEPIGAGGTTQRRRRDDVTLPYTEVLSRLISDYPSLTPGRIESILLREWEVFSSGRPLVIPIAVEGGTREMLERFR